MRISDWSSDVCSSDLLPGCPDAAGERLDVDLMADAGAGRHDPEIVEVLLRPAQEAVAAAVALELQVQIGLDGVRRAVAVHHDGVVDDQVGLDDRREDRKSTRLNSSH